MIFFHMKKIKLTILIFMATCLTAFAGSVPLAPEVVPLPEEQVAVLFDRIGKGEKIEVPVLYQALKGPQTTLRAYAARELGKYGDQPSIPYLIDALADESFHVGALYVAPGMQTTRYWVNESLKALTGQDFGFVWDDPVEKRDEAILRWREWYLTMGLAGAAQIEDGLYLRAQGEPALRVIGQEGRELFLEAGQEMDIQKSEIISQDNANNRFYLSLTVPYDETIGPSSYVLAVAGTFYEQWGAGSSREEASSLSFYISGEENAREVARYFATPVFYRRHPRHHLRAAFIPEKKVFSPDEQVRVTLQIENVGQDTIAFMKGGRNRAPRDNQYIFSARLAGRQVEDIGTSHHRGGIAFKKALRPGETFEDVVDLKKWFAFDKPGVYEIHGAYYLNFHDPDQDQYRTIWEDHVSGDFWITIGKGEGKACLSRADCRGINCAQYNTPGKEGYEPECVDGQCKCMCYGCE